MRVPAAFLVGAASHTGHVRVNNEDDYLLGALPPRQGELLFCAVADGMGGAAGGAEASRTAVRALGTVVLGADGDADLEARLREGFRAAGRQVFEQETAMPALHGMGTTLTALCLEPGRACVGHVGDTRLYRLRAGALERLTEDHAVREPDNLLTRCIGGGRAECEVDLQSFATQAQDRYLLVSDGVWGVLPAAELAALAARDDPQLAAEELVAGALAAGGPDNATALVVEVLGTAPSAGLREVSLRREERPGPRARWPRARALGLPLWVVVVFLLAAALITISALRWGAGIDLLGPLVRNW